MSEYISYQEVELLFKISRPTLRNRLKKENIKIHQCPGGCEKYILVSDLEKLKPKGISCQQK